MPSKTDLDLETLIKEWELYENPLSEKQQAILKAAEDLFTKKGFVETPTAEIAKKAQVTEKTLFKHFPKKDDLLRRILYPLVLKTLLPLQIKKVREILKAQKASYRETFLHLAKDRMDTAVKNGPKLKFVLSEMLRHDTFRKQLAHIWVEEIWREVEASMKKWQQEGVIRPDIPAATVARAHLFIIMGSVASRCFFPEHKGLNADEELKQMLEILACGSTKSRSDG